MPRILEPIDLIARKKQRDVLYLRFAMYNRERCPTRDQVLKWLEQNSIRHEMCYDFWSDGLIEIPYQGSIYLDLPYDLTDTRYQMLQSYFENTDGSMNLPGVTFCLLPLSLALKNAHHDDPGYWDNE